jgi:hypothetical protein
MNMNALLILVLALAYPMVHIANGFVFSFAEITPHIGLVYLPAFMRLFNVLVLGPLAGTLATFLGGMLLMRYFDEGLTLALLDVGCSAGGPLVALCLFKAGWRRDVDLSSLKDLTLLTLMYAPSNALLHHLMWSWLDPSRLTSPSQLLWMTLGDLLGALLGAYVLRWGVRRYKSADL